MDRLCKLILDNEELLIEHLLGYAKTYNYAKYMPTLKEAWRMSVRGLSNSILNALSMNMDIPELYADDDYSKDPIALFGILEAEKHRQRGITLQMFVSLMKYYKQSYIDLIHDAGFDKEYEEYCCKYLERCFDRIEIGFCMQWSRIEQNDLLEELQSKNRNMTNEKNKYLTVYESLPNPVIILDENNIVIDMNCSAAELFQDCNIPGNSYYTRSNTGECFEWLQDELSTLLSGLSTCNTFEKELLHKGKLYYFEIKLMQILDISEKFKGMVVILNDITKRKNLEKELTVLATTDYLTGANNRKKLLDSVQKEFLHSKKYGKPLSIMMIDVDHFKNINDNYGHHTGDIVLQEMVKECLSSLRKSDIFGRLGGEEFLVVLVDTEISEAIQVTERLRKNLSQLNIRTEFGTVYFTVSIGIACMKDEDENVEQLLERVDDALYKAKNCGRNRVEFRW